MKRRWLVIIKPNGDAEGLEFGKQIDDFYVYEYERRRGKAQP
jgi:hypothetical protein